MVVVVVLGFRLLRMRGESRVLGTTSVLDVTNHILITALEEYLRGWVKNKELSLSIHGFSS